MKTNIVFTAGAWDLFHVGHFNFLLQARGLGDMLVVGVMTDHAVWQSHGHNPIISYGERLAVIQGLGCVDIAVSHRHPKDYWAVDKFGATIRAAGPGYFETMAHIEAYNELTARGIEYVFIPRTPGISTENIKERCYEQLCKIRNSDNNDHRYSAYYRYHMP